MSPSIGSTGKDSFGAKGTLEVGGRAVRDLPARRPSRARPALPFSLKVLLENLLRTEDGANITADHIRALAGWDPTPSRTPRSSSRPARVIMQDFTGVPCVVDLATMREAVRGPRRRPDAGSTRWPRPSWSSTTR